VERYDRSRVDGRLIRVHQEDFCQALAVNPDDKYQKDGGPSASDIFRIISDYSSAAESDRLTFLRALIYNYLIAGTDGHAKNYGMLISGRGYFRLTPLYDIISILPYKYQPKKLKLAMKVGGEYLLWKINRQCWEKAAKEWGFDKGFVVEQILTIAAMLPDAAQAARDDVVEPVGKTLKSWIAFALKFPGGRGLALLK
jgi:serine/threonine-protein kinase HipA